MTETRLPIHDVHEELIAGITRSSRLILRAPTGSGKSTQVPQMLLDSGVAGNGQIVILQPRRLAARMLAARVARERGVKLGTEVGYQIRLDNVSGPATRILYVTEGILLRRMLADPELADVSVILFDEFHERHLFGDLSLAKALDLQETARPDLKLIVMSATLRKGELETYLAPCEIVESEGRTFPVEIEFLQREPSNEPVWEQAAEAVAKAYPSTPGHVLVFMPGAYEIQRTIQAIQYRLGGRVPVLPLHGELPPDQQDAAVGESDERRIIVSTNVAETSLTIQGVTLVVDSGLARVARFDPHRGINTLYIEKISHASADQRAGRAGRTAPGRCLRLWTQRDHERRPAAEQPEIRRLDLAETVLTLKAAGVGDLEKFRWLEPPDPKSLERSVTLLRDLGALDRDGAITAIGRRMLSFPVHPRYARMFLAAEQLGCVRAAALIAALTQSRDILLRADKRIEAEREDAFGEGISDFQILMRAWSWANRQGYRTDACRRLAVHAEGARQVGRLFEQFLEIAKREGLDVEARSAEDSAIAKCVLAGFADQVARRRSAGTLIFDVVHGRRGMLARDSVARDAKLIVVAGIDDIERGGEAQVLLTRATAIEEEWLEEMFPEDFLEESDVCFDRSQNRVVRRYSRVYRDLVLEERDRDALPSEEASACLAAEVIAGNLVLRQWTDDIEQWIIRVNRLSQWMPERNIPPIGEADRELLIHEICRDATSYRDIKDRPVRDVVRGWLTPQQQHDVDRFAPGRIELPGGRRAKITYAMDADPFIAVRIQDLYDLSGPLKIAGGRVPLTIQVLAPNMRPVQVTRDLGNFWKEVYPEIKPQLARRYPKHEWR